MVMSDMTFNIPNLSLHLVLFVYVDTPPHSNNHPLYQDQVFDKRLGRLFGDIR